MKPLNLGYLVFAVLGACAVLIPLPWHITVGNTSMILVRHLRIKLIISKGTVYLMIWTFLGCLIHIVDTAVWDGSLQNSAPVWCDIGALPLLSSDTCVLKAFRSATKVLMGLTVAIPLSSLCINRRLYNIATLKSATITQRQVRRLFNPMCQ